MDGSFLSDKRVVAASREFICIRLATYEDEKETAFLTKVFAGRDGELQNTVFALMSPDGKQFLTRTGRGPFFAFRGPEEMAQFMVESLDQFKPDKSDVAKPLPVMKSVDVALNVAACDGVQLVVRVTNGGKMTSDFDGKLATAAWLEKFAGQFVYAKATAAELEAIAGVEVEEGVVVAEPDGFGTSGLAIQQLSANANQEAIESMLQKALYARVPVIKNVQQHIRAGVRLGIDWETAVPVTDKQSVQAKSRYRGNE